MKDEEPLPLEDQRSSSRVGTLSGFLLLVWAVGFSVSEPGLSRPVYWTVFICVSILVVAVPCWLVGQRAKRKNREK